MYTAIKGIYEKGQIVLQEEPPTMKKMKVLVTFLDEDEESSSKRQPGSLRRLGLLREKNYAIPDDFNDPLDDLKEYME